MADEEQLFLILRQGKVDVWNKWREENPEYHPDLIGADFRMVDLSGANLSRANLSEADMRGGHWCGANLRESKLRWANLREADFSEADLSGADLSGAYLLGTNLGKANLSEAILYRAYLSMAYLNNANICNADLREATLSGADLSGADLSESCLVEAVFVRTNLYKTNLTGCQVYGISAWDLNVEGSVQKNLDITPPLTKQTITVDSLDVAQFVYLLLNNQKIRGFIDTITSKTVLILGRFAAERKIILDAVREALRQHNYLPVLFDFEPSSNLDLTETVRLLAHMSRFIIADITEPKSIPQELYAIVPDLAVPVQPLLLQGSSGEYALFRDLKRKYHWVLATYEYSDLQSLLSSLEEKVILPAEVKAKELRNM